MIADWKNYLRRTYRNNQLNEPKYVEEASLDTLFQLSLAAPVLATSLPVVDHIKHSIGPVWTLVLIWTVSLRISVLLKLSLFFSGTTYRCNLLRNYFKNGYQFYFTSILNKQCTIQQFPTNVLKGGQNQGSSYQLLRGFCFPAGSWGARRVDLV